MIFKDIKPDLIYVELQSVVKDLISAIDAAEIETADKEIANFSRNILNELDARVTGELDKLRANSEWDTFTIAFYGETNAGKSTIIETLRILLNEPQKVAAQQEFQKLVSSLQIDESAFNKINNEISELSQQCTEFEQRLVHAKDESNSETYRFKSELSALNKEIEVKRSSLNIFQKIWHLFSKLPEEIELVESQAKFVSAKQILDKNIAKAESELHEKNEKHAVARAKLESMENALKRLEPFADGAIIGDGRSDFTLDSQSYVMKGDASKFNILDVPGIEGKEEKVGESIWNAVHKAHAVFYVTSKATAPQTGDDKTKGTLEKIKEHLGDQTEVWSIYNKRITNPMQLQKSQLVSDSEIASLAELDTKMHEQLGANYRGTKSVCGLVGYLAAAKCLITGSADYKRKAKFLKGNNEQSLLDYCGLSDLQQFLTSDLIKDYKVKIMKANFNKANEVLKLSANSIVALRDDKFEPLHNTLKLEAASASEQLDIALNSLRSRLLSAISNHIDTFKSSVRKKIYNEIDEDISNDDFKYELKRAINRAKSEFDEQLPSALNSQLDGFDDEIKSIVERFQKHTSELFDMYSSFETKSSFGNLKLTVDIDSGVSVAGLIGTAIGAVALALSGAGIAALAIGAVGLVISFAKSIGSFFSSSYKMSQQKKAADDNIYDIAREIESTAETNIDNSFKELEENISTIKESLNTPIEHTALVNKILSISIDKLQKTSSQLVREL